MKTGKTWILPVFLPVLCPYFCWESARLSPVFLQKWARLKNWVHWVTFSSYNWRFWKCVILAEYWRVSYCFIHLYTRRCSSTLFLALLQSRFVIGIILPISLKPTFVIQFPDVLSLFCMEEQLNSSQCSSLGSSSWWENILMGKRRGEETSPRFLRRHLPVSCLRNSSAYQQVLTMWGKVGRMRKVKFSFSMKMVGKVAVSNLKTVVSMFAPSFSYVGGTSSTRSPCGARKLEVVQCGKGFGTGWWLELSRKLSSGGGTARCPIRLVFCFHYISSFNYVCAEEICKGNQGNWIIRLLLTRENPSVL